METIHPDLQTQVNSLPQVEAVEQSSRFNNLSVRFGAALLTASALIGPQLVTEEAHGAALPNTTAVAPEQGCQEVRVVGHRGMPGAHTENTLASFRDAVYGGANVLETDLRFTKDGYPVLMHDSTIGRTTRSEGYVKNYTLARLQRVRTNDGGRVPTLGQALRLAKNHNVPIQVEFKVNPSDYRLKKVRNIIGNLGMRNMVTITSFNQNTLKRFHRFAPNIDTGYLSDVPRYQLGYIRGFADWILYKTSAVRPVHVDAAHNAGLKVGTWTPNKTDQWYYLTKLVDSVTTDKASTFRQWCRNIVAAKQ